MTEDAATVGIEITEDGQKIYQPDGEVLAEYVSDRSPVAMIVGPIGSGSSTASCFRIYATAMEQRPSLIDGKRRSRWAIVRPTYPELVTSTMRTWLYWFPEEQYGLMNKSRPMKQVIEIGDLELEIWFLALDGPADIQKLRSVEYTGIWFNEIEFQSYEIFLEAKSRTGRFPPMAEGGSNWSGVIGDMNAPNEEHFVARMAGWAEYPDDVSEEKRIKWPANWWLKKQPPALIEIMSPDGETVTGYRENPEAENQKWLKKGYYSNLVQGADKRWIDSRLMNRVSFLSTGDPVWPGFREERHLSRHALEYVPDHEVIVALDFGRRPCALIGQEIGERLQLQREFRMYGVGSTVFAPALKRFLEKHYRGAKIRFVGDPKGRDRGQATENSSYDIFESYGMNVTPAPCPNNELTMRIEAVAYALMTMRILVSADCMTLRAALAGKYALKKLDMGDSEPIKDKYSDIADCLQYFCLFVGEGRRMLGLESVRTKGAVRVSAKAGKIGRCKVS
jgi:hypothetical protein